jgi:hypothetical protein
MGEKIGFEFDYACMQRYDLDSTDVDAALETAGLDRNCTIAEAKEAVKQYAVEHHFIQPLPRWI